MDKIVASLQSATYYLLVQAPAGDSLIWLPP